jgi:hypothetical protein
VENLALLRDPHSGVSIALVQGGSVGKTAGELARGVGDLAKDLPPADVTLFTSQGEPGGE